MLLVYGDESHDSKSQRVFAVAALFGTESRWAEMSARWTERLGGGVFHAADCEADRRAFAGVSHAENQRLYADLTNILAESRILGWGSAMDLAGHREFFPDVPPDTPYYRSFKDVVFECGYWAKISVPHEEVQFFFDHREKSDHNAGVLYSHIASLPDWDGSQFLRKTLKSASRSEVGIQAADLYAREIMKHFDNIIGPVPRPTRRSFARLLQTNRFGCDLHTREYFADFRSNFDEISVRAGMEQDRYHEWLRKNGQADTISTRHRYLIDREPQT